MSQKPSIEGRWCGSNPYSRNKRQVQTRLAALDGEVDTFAILLVLYSGLVRCAIKPSNQHLPKTQVSERRDAAPSRYKRLAR
jgi:hypothetical protein